MSTLLLNTLTGKTSAGSIVVTGEGGSTTTNLQQGVAKAWSQTDQDTENEHRDSFNMGAITDNGTGDITLAFTNSMSNNDYCYSGSNGNDAVSTASVTVNRPATFATGSIRFTSLFTSSSSTGAYDADAMSSCIHGDLA